MQENPALFVLTMPREPPTYPPEERFLRSLSKGSLWFEYPLSHCVIVTFFCFSPRDPCHLLCCGCCVVGGAYLKNVYVVKMPNRGHVCQKIAYFLLSNVIFFVDNGRRSVHYSQFFLLWGRAATCQMRVRNTG